MLGDGKRDESGPKEHRIRKLSVEKRGIRMQRSVPSSQTRQRRCFLSMGGANGFE